MSQLIETRWTRYGNDRVYVRNQAGDEIGHIDLKEHKVVAKTPGYESSLEECLRRWTSESQSKTPHESPTEVTEGVAPSELPPSAPALTSPSLHPYPTPQPIPAPTDLADNVAGAAAWAERERVNSLAPALNLVARVLGVKTDERSWRVGAKGEEKIARELARLGPSWHCLHAIEVGNRGSDIDHVVIGPPGVITINTKRHPRGKAWIGERMVMINGQKTDYLRNSRFEAERAAKLLSAACGRSIEVRAAIAFVDLDDFNVKQMPSDVHVTTRRRLLGWLRDLPRVVSDEQVEEIFAVARVSSTWSASPKAFAS
jgi:hypothetical protein